MEINSQPLAYRVRPKSLEDYVGQEQVLGKDKILYRTIKADRLSSIILWGPPGCGKTSLAKVISETTKYKFIRINAVTSGVQDIKDAIATAQNQFLNPSGKIGEVSKEEDTELLSAIENDSKVQEASQALQVLGYTRREIEDVISKVKTKDLSVEEIIRQCLSNLAR